MDWLICRDFFINKSLFSLYCRFLNCILSFILVWWFGLNNVTIIIGEFRFLSVRGVKVQWKGDPGLVCNINLLKIYLQSGRFLIPESWRGRKIGFCLWFFKDRKINVSWKFHVKRYLGSSWEFYRKFLSLTGIICWLISWQELWQSPSCMCSVSISVAGSLI